jgi:2-dehydro-3-deoxyphosphogluconate aldolase/(4S)-4-hydroxy-2-oxoglutarate aldolase
MAKFSRIEVVNKMQETKLVPLFFSNDISTAKSITKACYDGGARFLEFTHRGDFAQEVFKELSIYCNQELPEMILGVGSVTDAALASLYMAYGANFVVTPVLREDIAIVCNRKKVMWSAGCGSLLEICRAEELGCEVVKLFPGEVYGPSFISAVKGPQPWTSIMVTGGVTTEKENLNAWFTAGAFSVGMGSKLITKEIVKTGNTALLTQKVKEVLAIING